MREKYVRLIAKLYAADAINGDHKDVLPERGRERDKFATEFDQISNGWHDIYK